MNNVQPSRPSAPARGRQDDNRLCSRCDRTGYVSEDCFAEHKEDRTLIGEARKSSARAPDTRPEKVHLNKMDSSPGPSEPSPRPSTSREDPPEVITFHEARNVRVIVSSGQPMITHTISVYGTEVEALIDTRAYSTVMDSELATKNGWKIIGPGPKLVGSGNSPSCVVGSFVAGIKKRIRLNHLLLPNPVRVTPLQEIA